MPGPVTPAFLQALRGALGESAVVVDEAELASLGRDWTRAYTPRPGAAVFPRSTDEVQAVLRLASAHDVAVVPSGGRTGLAGGAVATRGELVLSLQKLRRIHPVDVLGRTLRVEAGAVTAEVHAAAEAAGLYWPIDLASKGSSTLGGNLATNAGGVRVLRYGATRQWVLGVRAVLASGEVLETGGALIKNNTGYDLVQLLVGSEGTLAVITEATLRLTARPGPSEVLFLGCPTIEAAAHLLPRVAEARLVPTAFEVLTDACLTMVERALRGRCPLGARAPVYVLLEVERPPDADALSRFFDGAVEAGDVVDGVVAGSQAQARELWSLRENVTASLADAYPRVHKDDIAVPVAAVPAFVRDLEALLARGYGDLDAYLFGHLGDGNLHVNLAKPHPMDDATFAARTAAFDKECGALLAHHRGSVSAEHGIGLLKRDLLAFTRSPVELKVFRALKALLDPQGILNPGKLIDADA